jgi:DNA-binding LacI/PurR family transcriptional regulator
VGPVAHPTLADVAQRAGVSRQTVSNALNNPSLLRADTLDRVRQVIDELGYSPNRAARNLRTRTSSLVGLRVGPAQEGTANAVMDRFTHALVGAMERAGLHVLLFPGDDEDPVNGYANLLRATAVDAFVVTDTYLGHPQARWLTEQGAPFVAFGRPWGDAPNHPWVDVDGAAGTALATQHLLAQSHTRIAWLGWRDDSPIGQDRRRGWEAAMREAGLDTEGLAASLDDSVESGALASAALLDEQSVTGFVCASDTLAMGVLHTLWARQLAPGRDVAVVGFDDSQVAQVFPVGLTSVRPPLEDAAVELVAMLHQLLSGHPVEPSHRLLAPTLAVRGSSTR